MKQFSLRQIGSLAALLFVAVIAGVGGLAVAAGPQDEKPLNERDRRAREVNQLLGRLYDAAEAPALRVLGEAPEMTEEASVEVDTAGAVDEFSLSLGQEPQPAANTPAVAPETAPDMPGPVATQPRLLVQRPAQTNMQLNVESGLAWADNTSTGSRVLSAVLAEIQSRTAPLFDLDHFSNSTSRPSLEPPLAGDWTGMPSVEQAADRPVVPVDLLDAGPSVAIGPASHTGAAKPAAEYATAPTQTASPALQTSPKPAVRVNRADATDLTRVLRVDAVRAANIVEFRDIYGNFSRPEDLAQVAGITNTMTTVWARAGLLAFD